MAEKRNDVRKFTKRQASVINRHNRNISGNINALIDQLNTMTYGIQRTDKIDNLNDEFNSLLKSEIDTLTKRSDGDTTTFLTKLFSENNRRNADVMRDLENMFNVNEGQIDAFLNEQYRNRLIKLSDIHEVASQLNELSQAITITRDAIVSADIVTGKMSRTLNISNSDIDSEKDEYVTSIEKIEDKFELHDKIKNFIIPKTLEYGEYYAYTIPYSQVFKDFSRMKENPNNPQYRNSAYTEGVSVYDYYNINDKKKHTVAIAEAVKASPSYKEGQFSSGKNDLDKQITEYLKNVSINNTPVPLCVLEEGVEGMAEYYSEFVEKVMTEDNKNNKNISFEKIMSSIDSGVHAETKSSGKKESSKNEFSNITDCYIKLIDPLRILPIEIMNECIGYYYIMEEDITPLSGILTSTMYYDKYDGNRAENNVLSSIAEAIVGAFDKKFLEKNIKFKRLIVEALNYYKLNNRKIRFQFIPKEYIQVFKVNKDEEGHGRSRLENSLFYAKLYLMLLLFKIMTIVLNSNDTKVNYVRSSGIDKNIINKIQEISRRKQERQITLTDMFSYTTLINKIGSGNEMYVPVGKSNERGIETEILSGQDVQLNNDLMEMLKKGYVSGTSVPEVLMNYLNEADFAKTLELANTRFNSTVASDQLDLNRSITEWYRMILRYTTTIPENVISDFEFNFIQPKNSNNQVTGELINAHNTYQEFMINLLFGQDAENDPKLAKSVKKFKVLLAKDKLPQIFDHIDELYEKSMIEGIGDSLDPSSDENSDEGGGDEV